MFQVFMALIIRNTVYWKMDKRILNIQQNNISVFFAKHCKPSLPGIWRENILRNLQSRKHCNSLKVV
ncbi:hypothetical protein JTB14_005527 [Gonioctena quinquepunctata]|nr:hypothetical protein JTB14_005527 [Gonioctena quinquepunctata]